MHKSWKLLLGCLFLCQMTGSLCAGSTDPGDGSNTSYGTLRIVNQTDDAIGYQLGNNGFLYLEPLESTDLEFGMSKGTLTLDLTVTLASDTSVSAQKTVSIRKNKVTTATVTSSVVGGDVQLHLEVTGESKGNSKKK